jgi:hypothetical protein
MWIAKRVGTHHSDHIRAALCLELLAQFLFGSLRSRGLRCEPLPSSLARRRIACRLARSSRTAARKPRAVKSDVVVTLRERPVPFARSARGACSLIAPPIVGRAITDARSPCLELLAHRALESDVVVTLRERPVPFARSARGACSLIAPPIVGRAITDARS